MAERINTDVLVVGGSIAGMAAAITAKEAEPALDVLVAEKYTAGYAGKANRGAGIMLLRGDYTPQEFVEYHVKNIGLYMNDQDFLTLYAEELNNGVTELDKWSGGKFDRDEKGEIRTLKWRAQLRGVDEGGVYDFDEDNEYPWTLAAIDLDYMLEVRKYALRLGVKFVDRTGVTDVLKSDGGEACGAVGFDIDTGETRVFSAKAVVLANGCQNYRIMPMWSTARGEGLLAAWRAGAAFTNGEFGLFYNWTSPHNFESEMGVEYALYNNKGENVGKPYTAEPHPDIDQGSLAEYYKQVKAGNGPLTYNPEENIMLPYTRSMLGSDAAYYKRPYTNKFWGKLIFNAATQQPSDVIIAGLIGELGNLMVDKEMKASVEGLFAAGDICYAGTRGYGAAPVSPGRMRGSGIGFSTFAGRMAGPSAARYAAGLASAGAVPEGDVAGIEARFNAPLSRTGSIGVNDFVFEIQKVMQPLGNSLYKHEERLDKAIGRLLDLRSRLGSVEAKSPHHLFGVNEAEAMLICGELFFRASLERRESIGWFVREDYPDPPEEKRWIIIENDGGMPKLTPEPIAFKDHWLRPEQGGDGND
ncbi:MAG: FAD-binding protein [Clostridiales bacterium]|nr:FAD-binding protein [Clostridiales bacterium]